MKHPAEWTPEEIQAQQDKLRKLETSSQELCDLLQGRKLTIEDRLNIVEAIIEKLRELDRLERINAALIARLCGTFVASRWVM
jgi:t-SNARE complex subunit (syntaxin)